MIDKSFEAGAWIDRLSKCLADLTKAQRPHFIGYGERRQRKVVIPVGLRAEDQPFPLDDLRMLYAHLRRELRLVPGVDYQQVRAALDTTRHALLSHPQLERVAVSGRTVGENNFWLRIGNSGSSTSAGDLISGLMARASEVPVDGFRVAVREMNAFLQPVEDDAARALGDLDEGCHALLFYGLTLNKRLDVEEGLSVLPSREVFRFVVADLLEKLAPTAAFHNWESIGAVVRTYRWRPTFSQRGTLNEPTKHPPTGFFTDGGVLLDLVSVSQMAPVVRLATISGCVDQRAARLFGRTKHGPGFCQTYDAGDLGRLGEPASLRPQRFDEACELFRERRTPNYRRMSRFVGLLAKALERSTYDDQIVDAAKALEGMYRTPRRHRLRALKRKIAGLLGANEADRGRIKEHVQAFYDTRSKIVHGDLIEGEPFRKGAAFVSGFGLARKSLFKLIREGAPASWESPGASR